MNYGNRVSPVEHPPVNKEHPHATILRAIADGKTIQMQRPNGEWENSNLYQFVNNTCADFRIKPEVVQGYLNVFTGATQVMFSTRELADKHAQQMLAGNALNLRVACLHISYTPGEGL